MATEAQPAFPLCSNEVDIYSAMKRSTWWHWSFTIYKKAESSSPPGDDRNHLSGGTGDCKVTKWVTDRIQGKQGMDAEVHEALWLQFMTTSICMWKTPSILRGEASLVPKVHYQEKRKKGIPSGANRQCDCKLRIFSYNFLPQFHHIHTLANLRSKWGPGWNHPCNNHWQPSTVLARILLGFGLALAWAFHNGHQQA